jgi:hypothetical protein
MAKKLSDVLAKLPKEVLDTLPAEDRQVILAETLDPDTLLQEDMSLEGASTILLRVSSLLSGKAVDAGVEWPPELGALALLEDKKLVALAKKTLRLNCFKLRASSNDEEKGKASNKKSAKSDCPLP